ncbi:EfeM/EfeO family lipoprotein [Streptomyces sp. MI02-2A]|uniref:EfeM/EfeO family lipoprotein n=1 Tax=unclassified Streptomyces TaxID=2593676 RepID=UPI000E247CCA|nr:MULTISPECIES: EfeM/EfeO family lipoprotein [unclassified Streptomyces]MDX3259515.1 EfeM/EfeO family lipoprotein [Streptomyces sp. MI02-2A]REE65114.1 iron uptake system component EfeO [Streptomyces sp. 3212.3]
MPVPGLTSRRGRVWAAGGLLLTLVLVAALLITTLGGARHARAAGDGLRHTAVEVSPSGCGRGWTSPVPGLQVFDLHNTSSSPAEVYLEDPRSRAVYGELEGLAAGTTRSLTVRLGKGSYAFTCLPDDADAVTGPTVRVSTGGRPGPAAAPVTQHDLIPLAIDYQKWVGGGLNDVVRLTGRLQDAIDRGDLDAARKAWLPAHLEYERLGAAYDAFGDSDAQINGTDAGLPGGVKDPSFVGFHRIEYGLWHGGSAQQLRAPAAALTKAVRGLRDDWAQARMDPAQLGLRAHEILENTVQFELTGRTDYGSGTSLATARANIDGTRAVLSRLHPLLASRYADLPVLERDLDRAQRTLDGLHHGDRWTPLTGLDRTQREQVDAVLDDLVERLASVATLCDPRRTV